MSISSQDHKNVIITALKESAKSKHSNALGEYCYSVQLTPRNVFDHKPGPDISPTKSQQASLKFKINQHLREMEDSIEKNQFFFDRVIPSQPRIQRLDNDFEIGKYFQLRNSTFKEPTVGIYKNDEEQIKTSSTRAKLLDAVDRHSSKECVIKVIEKSKLCSFTGGEQLWRELCLKLLKISSQHPGLMTVSEVFESDTKFYLVCEKLNGGELFEFLLTEKAVPEELCKYIIKQILRALDFLHSSWIVHRDVKPENLIFRRQRPKIIDYSKPDQTSPLKKSASRNLTSLECSQSMSLERLSSTFELAMIDFDTCKIISPSSSEYQEIRNGKRRLVGTYGYLAPEVLKGYEYTKASDLWSVGIILYILITGAPPVPMEMMVNAKASSEVLDGIRRYGIDFRLAPFPEFPRAKDLCQALLEFDPKCRLSSAYKALQHPWLRTTASNAIPFQINNTFLNTDCKLPYLYCKNVDDNPSESQQKNLDIYERQTKTPTSSSGDTLSSDQFSNDRIYEAH